MGGRLNGRIDDERASILAVRRLRASGLVGCSRGPRDLSVSYKRELTRSLAKKTGSFI